MSTRKSPNLAEWVKAAFKAYYSRASSLVEEPSEIAQREFAFAFFDRPGMHRHIVFRDAAELRGFVARSVPRHAYYSSAYYRYPDAERMDEKVWLGADLVFDIDVDHIDTPCKALHDSWQCPKCGASGKGFVETCPKCGYENVKRKTWVCETCINVARDEVIKLVEMLTGDFGLSSDEVHVVFSGHRGFHVHVESEVVKELGQDARREIADYVRGMGLEPEAFTVPGPRRTLRLVAKPEDPGWYGRVARSVLDWILSLDEKSAALIARGRRVRTLVRLAERLRGRAQSADWLEEVELTRAEWLRLLSLVSRAEGAHIDERVTIDVKRLIRLPGSLHGKTGLRVSRLSLYELENVDVIREARVFGDDEIMINAVNVPQKALDVELQAKAAVLKVPLYLLVYLVANGAEIGVLESPPIRLASGI